MLKINVDPSESDAEFSVVEYSDLIHTHLVLSPPFFHRLAIAAEPTTENTTQSGWNSVRKSDVNVTFNPWWRIRHSGVSLRRKGW